LPQHPRFYNFGNSFISLEEKLIPKRRKGKGNGVGATKEQLAEVGKLQSETWDVVVPKTPLKPGYASSRHNFMPVETRKCFTHLRLNFFPDGGVARLRVFGQVSAPVKKDKNGLTDLVAMENGGLCVGYSDAHFGHPRNLILPGEPANMGDGWETARRLDRPEVLTMDTSGVLKVPGYEWAAFRLGTSGVVSKIQIDTTHFKGNFPDSVRIFASADYEVNVEGDTEGEAWEVLLPPQKVTFLSPFL